MPIQPSKDEIDILNQASSAFNEATGASIKILGRQILHNSTVMDAQIQVTIRGTKLEFYVEIKGEMRHTMLDRILTQFREQMNKWLLVARYIPAPLKAKLRKLGINYLETTGNCCINTDNLYIYINDRPVKQARQTPEGRLWKASGLKLLFLLIQDPTLIDATYRYLSQLAGIALGSISPLLDELRQEGFLKKVDNTEKEVFIHQDRLISRWTELYSIVLRPKLFIGHFRFTGAQNPEYWKDLSTEGFYWGGEPAGELYTLFLKPETYTLYTNRQLNELVRKWRIVPDENGLLSVFEKFWQDWPGSKSLPGAVPPLLVYADLLNSADSRAWEAALAIKNKYFHGNPVL